MPRGNYLYMMYTYDHTQKAKESEKTHGRVTFALCNKYFLPCFVLVIAPSLICDDRRSLFIIKIFLFFFHPRPDDVYPLDMQINTSTTCALYLSAWFELIMSRHTSSIKNSRETFFFFFYFSAYFFFSIEITFWINKVTRCLGACKLVYGIIYQEFQSTRRPVSKEEKKKLPTVVVHSVVVIKRQPSDKRRIAVIAEGRNPLDRY